MYNNKNVSDVCITIMSHKRTKLKSIEKNQKLLYSYNLAIILGVVLCKQSCRNKTRQKELKKK